MDSIVKLIIDDYIVNINDAGHKLLDGINIQEGLNLKTQTSHLNKCLCTLKIQ